MRILILILFTIFGLFSFSQKEGNVWCFGKFAGLDFNSGTPIVINGSLNTIEGCASICDNVGVLLFYTDGRNVWNSNHSIMPNGIGLDGHVSSTQSAIIVKKPGSSTMYYIFTADAQSGSNGLKYSEVDITLQGGLGDVTGNKNIQIVTPICEKVTAIKHRNGQDFWIVTHFPSSNTYNSYLLSSSGLNFTPVVSSIGAVTGSGTETVGYLKASPNSDKLVSVTFGASRVQIFDFDNSTGALSNVILLANFPSSHPYGAEFARDGKLLYISEGATPFNLNQFNLLAGNSSAVQNSKVVIGTNPTEHGRALQLAPDNKIYYARYLATSLGVINNPNLLGMSCNYINNGIPLGGKISTMGLPNFFSSIYISVPILYSSSLSVPNVFSPNGDLKNDLFSMNQKNILSIEGRIYNRWGQEMFFWDKLSESWDGNYNYKEASAGVYYYIVKAIGKDGKSYFEKGSLSLFR